MLNSLSQEFGAKASPARQAAMEALRQKADVDAQFADAIKNAGNVVLGHLFLDANRAKYADRNRRGLLQYRLAKRFPRSSRISQARKTSILATRGFKPVARWPKASRPTCRNSRRRGFLRFLQYQSRR